MTSDERVVSRGMNDNYSIVDFDSTNPLNQFTPDATKKGYSGEKIRQIPPIGPRPMGGARVAGLHPNPLPPMVNTPSKSWKPHGRKD
jgi:hypothetical protein